MEDERKGMGAEETAVEEPETPGPVSFRFERAEDNLARCAVCKTSVYDDGYVCHHCDSALCRRHAMPGKAGVSRHRSFEFLGAGRRGLLARLGFGGKSRKQLKNLRLNFGYHCSRHYHTLRSYLGLVLFGLLLLVLGIGLLASLDPSSGGGSGVLRGIGTAFLLIGIAMAGGFGFLHYLRFVSQISSPLDACPIEPSQLHLSVAERIHGRFRITEGTATTGEGYLADVSGSGEISLNVDLDNQVRETLQDFCATNSCRGGLDSIDWNAGYLLLHNTRNVTFHDRDVYGKGNVIPLLIPAGQERRKLDAYLEEDRLHQVFRTTYDITREGGIIKGPSYNQNFPAHVFPEVGAIDGRTMNLLFRPGDESTQSGALRARRLRLTLDVPPELNVERARPEGKAKYDPMSNVITWSWHRRGQEDLLKETQRNCPFVVFKEKILETLAPDAVLTGTYEVEFDGNLSGFKIDEEAVFLPSGTRRNKDSVKIVRTTVVHGEFEIDVRALSCMMEFPVNSEFNWDRLIPDHSTANYVCDLLTEAGVFIAKVEDNPPVQDAKAADVKRRNWDLLGRKYIGSASLFPVDIHLVLSGEERFEGGNVPRNGSARLEMSVRALVHNDDTRQIVNGLCDELRERIEEKLDAFEHPLILAAEKDADVDVGSASSAPAASNVGEALDRLEQRLESLDDALIDGKITEERYAEMKSRIEEKIAGLTGEEAHDE